jgi:hypothetical protein
VILPLLLTSVLLCSQPTPERGCNKFDEKGRVVRSQSAKLDFLECVTGERKSKAGYYVEHLIPLACGGSDRARNMALVPIRLWDWKRRWERKDCEQTKEFLLALGVGEACYEEN